MILLKKGFKSKKQVRRRQ